jgi:cystathionine beta-lyase
MDTPHVPAVFDVPLEDLRRRRSYKWRAFTPDVLPAFVAEMDCVLAAPIRAALKSASHLGDAGYAWPSPELNEALAGFAASRFGWKLDPDDVTLVPDVMMGVLELLRILCAPGDGVVVNPPVYPPFFSHIVEAGCRVVEAPLARAGTGYELDFEALERAFESARVFLLCNPHNPTGRVLTREELDRVAELAERHDVLVFADEIHAPLVLSGATHTPFLTLDAPAVSRAIAFVSASKAWNLPGLKCAQVIAVTPAMRTAVQRLSEDVTFRVGHHGVLASTAAYRESGAWLDELLAALDRNRRLMGRLLEERLPGAVYAPPQGGYLAWVDCSALGLAADPATAFLERGRVAVRSGPDFGMGGDGFVRVTMGTSATLLEEVVTRMAAAVPAAQHASQ